MATFFSFISYDLKIIFRDKTLLLIFFVPLLLVLVCRLLVPFITTYFPPLEGYYWLIAAAFCVLTGSFPAFLTAFIMLDEKDENLLPVLKVIPIPYPKIVTYRILFLMLTSFIFSMLFLTINGLVYYSFITIFLSALLVSFIPAILLMLILPLARNKIEGVTLFKGINMILFIPIIAFFILTKWKILFAIIPFYWVYDILYTDLSMQQNIWIKFISGVIVNSAWFYLLVLFFKRRYVNRIN